jgi:muconate cycloisomerase
MEFEQRPKIMVKNIFVHFSLNLATPWRARWDINGMARVKRESGVSVAACESATTMHNIMEIIKKEAADIIHLKIQRSGGLYKAKQIAGMVEAAGLLWNISTMLCSGIENAVNAHFAASTTRPQELPYGYEFGIGILKMFGVMDTSTIEDKDIVKNTPKIESGYIRVPKGPGLGVELVEEKIAKYISEGKRRITITSDQ